ncbi:hypothetical protein E2986_13799 [Frieseomelitta varia]|uniref:Uncharacterized protein n=1 Tax=Frieseomelitta varia TaxID=561572 RepID=A0A833RI42_9HYME|nr:hypothetical protein E2986_13799 [Frieseomelitta varia]
MIVYFDITICVNNHSQHVKPPVTSIKISDCYCLIYFRVYSTPTIVQEKKNDCLFFMEIGNDFAVK